MISGRLPSGWVPKSPSAARVAGETGVVAPAQATEAGQRQRPGVTVHVARVQILCCQPDLERRDVRVAHGPRSSRRNERQHDGKEGGDADVHTFPIGAWT